MPLDIFSFNASSFSQHLFNNSPAIFNILGMNPKLSITYYRINRSNEILLVNDSVMVVIQIMEIIISSPSVSAH
jgi:Na+-translocating ferredoxin:NAD+ oxidoreductase RnfE subunit